MDLPATPRFPSPGSLAAMDQILAGDGDLVMNSESDLPSLPSLSLPVPSPRVLPPEPPVVPSAGGSPDLSQEGPFDVSQDSSVSGATPGVMDNLPGCQYRTTTYEDTQATTADPGYGLQLQNPRFLEYVGAPESARLLTRSPEYWLHHMTHDEAITTALQLQHDMGLMMTNLQILSSSPH